MKFWVIDAFTQTPFCGNPAAVFVVDEFLPDVLMQNIAAELRHSQTAFIKQLDEKHFCIRWFTPNSEAPLCGHATIASACVLLELDLMKPQKEVVFESLAGQLTVQANLEGWITLNFPKMRINEVSAEQRREYLEVVAQEPSFIGFSEGCIFMEYQDRNAIKALKPDLVKLEKITCRALIVTARDHEFDFCSRYFAPRVGIPEDPVCASAHCRLIPYWAEKLQKNELIAFQASQRTGILKCTNLENRVLISGKAVKVLEGNFSCIEEMNL